MMPEDWRPITVEQYLIQKELFEQPMTALVSCALVALNLLHPTRLS